MGERTPGARAAATQRAEKIAERAVAYAEEAIEGVELSELLAADLHQVIANALRDTEVGGVASLPIEQRAQLIAHHVVGSLPVANVVTRNMVEITHAMARAFTVGYGAKIDDATPAERLGGVAEDERRGKRRG